MKGPVRHRPTCGLTLALLVAALGVSGLAEGRSRPRHERPSAESLEKAAQSLGDARAALKAGDLAGAQRLAALAFRQAQAPDALFVLGQVAVAEHRLVDAQDLVRRYLADPNLDASSDGAEPAAEVKEAQRILEQPRPAAGQLSILGDRGALVSIDDRVVGTLPLVRPLLVTPGDHRVVLERGSARLEDQVRITVGRLGELRCNFASKALVLTLLPAVLWVSDAGQLSPAEQTQLGQTVEASLQQQRVSPIGAHDAASCGEPVPGCGDAGRCQLQSAQRCEADYVLRTQVRRTEAPPASSRLHVELELVDVAVGETAAREVSDCTGCTVAQALAGLSAKLPALVERATGRARSRLEVVSEPAGATVRLDGRALGLTPYQGAVWAGSHQLSLKKEGFTELTQTVEASDGQAAQVTAALVAIAAPEPPPRSVQPVAPSRPLWRLLGGGIAIGAGAVLVGFGISALAVNGNCTDQPFTHNSACADIYSTAATGGALVGVGGALLVGGAVLIALPPRKQP